MTLEEIEATLSWGLHDAYLEAIDVDWLKGTLVLSVRVMITERQDMEQRARITITGLVFCSIDAPEIDPARGYEPMPEGGLRINAGEGPANEEARSKLPRTPEGCFLHWLFVQQWNRFIHICGREAELTWTEQAPTAARAANQMRSPRR